MTVGVSAGEDDRGQVGERGLDGEGAARVGSHVDCHGVRVRETPQNRSAPRQGTHWKLLTKWF